MTGQDENMILGRLCFEVRRLLEAGEPLESLIPSLVDLFLCRSFVLRRVYEKGDYASGRCVQMLEG